MKTPYLDEKIERLKGSVYCQDILKEYEAIKERLLTDEEFEILLGIYYWAEVDTILNNKDKALKNKIEKILK